MSTTMADRDDSNGRQSCQGGFHMAVVGVTELVGDSKDLLAKYDQVNAAIRSAGAPAPGLISHTCLILPTGLRIANIWESEEQLWSGFNSDTFQSAVKAAGMEPVRPTVYPVHNYMYFGAPQPASTT
jgi:hypothetical protein